MAPDGVATSPKVNVKPDVTGLTVLGTYTGNVGRIAQAQEVAGAIVFLASDAASDLAGGQRLVGDLNFAPVV